MITKNFFPRAVSPSPFHYVGILARFISASLPTLHPYASSYHSLRDRGEDSKNVRVSVWWDFENCHVPAGVNVLKVAQIITAAVRANGIKGPVQIAAFGDVVQLSRANQIGLSTTGVNTYHIPGGGKNCADISILINLMYWVSQNPPPAHLFLISGDSDFASILHRLRMYNYNILLACSHPAPSVLCSAATIMWQWPSLIKEENLIGRHFNQPPDGPFGSWYGHYKGSLENPFSDEGPKVRSVETCNELSKLNARLVLEVRPIIPHEVLKQISHMLSLYPRGIPIVDLWDQLVKSDGAELMSNDDEDDADSESEDEEMPRKVESEKKRPGDSGNKTPAHSKKQKTATPNKTDSKKNVHTATPHPAKKPAANCNTQTPKSVGQFSCKSCGRSFNSDTALHNHTKAKHDK